MYPHYWSNISAVCHGQNQIILLSNPSYKERLTYRRYQCTTIMNIRSTAPFHVINEFIHTIPAVISIPHSGTYLTQQMKQNLKPNIVLPNTDWYLPILYSFLQQLGYTVIVNHTSRYVADVNRSLEDAKGTSYKTNVCYTYTTQGYAMYQEEPDVCELKHRIACYYQTYHNKIEKLISEKLNYHNQIYFIDLHSFGLNYGTDVILGNDFWDDVFRVIDVFYRTYIYAVGLFCETK